MRVLRTVGSTAEDWVPRLCTHRGEPYAILSHRWLKDANYEVLFADIEEIDRTQTSTPVSSNAHIVKNAQYAGGAPADKPGFKKLQGAARQALKDGYDYIWIDTCCIDKSSSAELAEAIKSMFKWYRASTTCYAYLADVPDATDISDGSPFTKSQWWKRGWTLQELLAPSKLTFFTRDWEVIGRKESLATIISGITGISEEALRGLRELETFSIASRMSWASDRTTTRPEDIAYCLMGLFDVNMPILYGEGEKAFIRLQQEMIRESDDESIFAWRDTPIERTWSGMLATRPAAFAGSRNVDYIFGIDDRPPYSMTNKGLSITLPLWYPPNPPREHALGCIAFLKCTTAQQDGEQIGIFLERASSEGIQYARWEPQNWIEGTPYKCHETSSILVRQSWRGIRGVHGILEMRDDMENSRPSTPEEQVQHSQDECNIPNPTKNLC